MLACSSRLALIPRLHPLIERLQNSRIHRRNHVDGGIKFLLRHPRFPCVRKAPLHSWIAQSHHSDGDAHEHLLALGQTLDGVGVFIECSEISFFHCRSLKFRTSTGSQEPEFRSQKFGIGRPSTDF